MLLRPCGPCFRWVSGAEFREWLGRSAPMAFWAQAGAMPSSPRLSEGAPQQSRRSTKQRLRHSLGPELQCVPWLHPAGLGVDSGLAAVFRHYFHLRVNRAVCLEEGA